MDHERCTRGAFEAIEQSSMRDICSGLPTASLNVRRSGLRNEATEPAGWVALPVRALSPRLQDSLPFTFHHQISNSQKIPHYDSMMTSDTTNDIQGLREQILANAAFYFTKARNEHYYKNCRVPCLRIPHQPQNFDIIIQKTDGSYSAVLICGNPDKRAMAAAGGWTHDASSALESLLDVMSKAVARKVDLLGGREKDMRVTGNGIKRRDHADGGHDNYEIELMELSVRRALTSCNHYRETQKIYPGNNIFVSKTRYRWPSRVELGDSDISHCQGSPADRNQRTQPSSSPKLFCDAMLICGDLRERILLAEGSEKRTRQDALASLSRVICKACGKKEQSLRYGRAREW
ncbi:uncharacterized protein MYCFIDRAFT_176399 [Pseudocercospora fijiensis CIRAD86]|uniref:Uncharacterized protein n=1 Tax=Pseudocercospora fijiensis (strain CIRAD86) TaxID=383855 RepID=M2YTJ0_PSEFD|nr:uncharacterized protein MYCFIDRAFT_176399 [Pseudocercospora fijiensis CIRAD86]EME81070.1 hypothetical protein MYCFIDRAFT_176399 [Pseudocercospora fijiensis CIRAD86]